jgi:hypothetical protein
MYVYLDESGDTGLKIRRGGSSHYFTVVLLLVDDPIPLHQVVHDLRLRLSLPEAHEFKFGSTGREYRNAFFEAIRPCAFELRALVIDKGDPAAARLLRGAAMYQSLVGLILMQEREVLRDRTLVIDESVQSRRAQVKLATALRQAASVKLRGDAPLLKAIVFHRSHQDNLIQVADMAAGAVARAHERGDDQYLRRLGHKLRVARFPGLPPGDPSH